MNIFSEKKVNDIVCLLNCLKQTVIEAVNSEHLQPFIESTNACILFMQNGEFSTFLYFWT